MKISADGICNDAGAAPNPCSDTFIYNVGVKGCDMFYTMGDLALLTRCGHLCDWGEVGCCACEAYDENHFCSICYVREKLAERI